MQVVSESEHILRGKDKEKWIDLVITKEILKKDIYTLKKFKSSRPNEIHPNVKGMQ